MSKEKQTGLSKNQFDCHIEFVEILTIKLSTFAKLRLTIVCWTALVVLFPVFFKHQFLYLFLILLLFIEVEHSAKDMIPKRGAYTKSLVIVFVVMQVMISPQGFHPFERRVPRMNSIVHSAIHEVSQNKTREKHECILTQK